MKPFSVSAKGPLARRHHYDPRVVDQHVETAKGSNRLSHGLLHRVGIGAIRTDRDRSSAGRLNGAQHFTSLRLIAGIGNRDGRAVLHQTFRNRCADPARRACDHGNLARQFLR
jgi:hypothetical protein